MDGKSNCRLFQYVQWMETDINKRALFLEGRIFFQRLGFTLKPIERLKDLSIGCLPCRSMASKDFFGRGPRQLTKIVSLGRFLAMPTCVHEYRDPGLFYVVFGLVFRSRYASNHIKSYQIQSSNRSWNQLNGLASWFVATPSGFAEWLRCTVYIHLLTCLI